MSSTSRPAAAGAVPGTGSASGVIAALSTLDRFLPVWIIAAMAAGCCSAGWCPA